MRLKSTYDSHHWNQFRAFPSRVTITASILSSFVTSLTRKYLSNLFVHPYASSPENSGISNLGQHEWDENWSLSSSLCRAVRSFLQKLGPRNSLHKIVFPPQLSTLLWDLPAFENDHGFHFKFYLDLEQFLASPFQALPILLPFLFWPFPKTLPTEPGFLALNTNW